MAPCPVNYVPGSFFYPCALVPILIHYGHPNRFSALLGRLPGLSPYVTRIYN